MIDDLQFDDLMRRATAPMPRQEKPAPAASSELEFWKTNMVQAATERDKALRLAEQYPAGATQNTLLQLAQAYATIQVMADRLMVDAALFERLKRWIAELEKDAGAEGAGKT